MKNVPTACSGGWTIIACVSAVRFRMLTFPLWVTRILNPMQIQPMANLCCNCSTRLPRRWRGCRRTGSDRPPPQAQVRSRPAIAAPSGPHHPENAGRFALAAPLALAAPAEALPIQAVDAPNWAV